MYNEHNSLVSTLSWHIAQPCACLLHVAFRAIIENDLLGTERVEWLDLCQTLSCDKEQRVT